MFCHVATGDQYVINVAKGEAQALKCSVHEALKRLCRILQTKRHAEKFPQPKRGDDSRLGYDIWVDRELVVAPDQVNLGEDSGAS